MSYLLLLFSLLLVSHIPTHMAIAFAQHEKQQEFSVWTHPQSKFSINYPSYWKVEEEGKRFEKYEVTFADPTNSSHLSIYFDESYDNEGVEGSQDLRFWFEIFTLGFGSSIPGYNEISNIEYEEYLIDGHQSGSVIFTGINNTEGLLVGALIDDQREFIVAFVTKQSNFDSLLPIVNDMISSAKVSSLLKSSFL